MTLKTSRLKDLILVIFLVGSIAGVSHFVITSPLGPSRILYFFQAPIIQWTTTCSSDAPGWMAGTQRYATRQMAAPASQLAYIDSQGHLHHCETGWRDGTFGEESLPPDARFRFASLTKTVTAAAVIDLVNQGRLSLDDKIVELIGVEGEFRDSRVADITVEHLLSHRGGWDRERTQDVMFLRSARPWCPGTPEKLSEAGLMYEPGAVESYSNLGYCLLGLVIERISGTSYRDYIADRYSFDGSTLAFVDGPYLPDEVEYDTRHENLYTINYHKHFDFKAIASSAGLSGSASDLARLINGVVSDRPLNILSGSLGSQCVPDEAQECFGYGVHIYRPDSSSQPLYVHEGKFPGNTTTLVVDDHGGVLVWLGAGSVSPGSNSREKFYQYIHEVLAGQ